MPYNKFLAKLASDNRKLDGLFVITPRMGPAFVESLPVGKFHGIGPATTAKMNPLAIHTGLDLRSQTLQRFTSVFSAVRNLFVPSHSRRSAFATHLHRLDAMAEWRAAAGLIA